VIKSYRIFYEQKASHQYTKINRDAANWEDNQSNYYSLHPVLIDIFSYGTMTKDTKCAYQSNKRKRRTKLSLYLVETREIFSWGKRVERYSLRFIVSLTFLTLSLTTCFIQKNYTNIVKLGYY